jgi:hypothetical protein
MFPQRSSRRHTTNVKLPKTGQRDSSKPVSDETGAVQYSDKAGVFHAEEHEDGAISFWFGGLELPATAFPKEHAVRPVEVVENKRLNAALEFMRVQQKRRVDAQVAKTSTTRRDARLLREGTQGRTTPPAGP